MIKEVTFVLFQLAQILLIQAFLTFAQNLPQLQRISIRALTWLRAWGIPHESIGGSITCNSSAGGLLTLRSKSGYMPRPAEPMVNHLMVRTMHVIRHQMPLRSPSAGPNPR